MTCVHNPNFVDKNRNRVCTKSYVVDTCLDECRLLIRPIFSENPLNAFVYFIKGLFSVMSIAIRKRKFRFDFAIIFISLRNFYLTMCILAYFFEHVYQCKRNALIKFVKRVIFLIAWSSGLVFIRCIAW